MKITQPFGLIAVGFTCLVTSASAQRISTNPTAVPNTVSSPTFSPDTLRPSRSQMMNDNTAGQDDDSRKNRRNQKRSMRRNKRNSENTRGTRNGNTSVQTTNPQDGAYRNASMSNGTVNNNSNNTNYNSNNVTTAPTGVGANPSATGTAGDVRPGTVESGSTMPSQKLDKSTMPPNTHQPAGTGTGQAVTGAENAPLVNTNVSAGLTTVADFLAAQPDYTTLQNALQSVNLNETLKGGQNYTVFAPSNAAFKKLPTKTQNVLLEGQNRESLKQLLSYHVVQETLTMSDLTQQINASRGQARLKTLNGSELIAKLSPDGRLMLTDEQGNTAYVDTPNKSQANGVVHGIDNVLMLKQGSTLFR